MVDKCKAASVMILHLVQQMFQVTVDQNSVIVLIELTGLLNQCADLCVLHTN